MKLPSKIQKLAEDLPKTVERYVKEHQDQGMAEDKAWAVAWSRYCQYKNPDSPRCKQDEYFHGKGKQSSIGPITRMVQAITRIHMSHLDFDVELLDGNSVEWRGEAQELLHDNDYDEELEIQLARLSNMRKGQSVPLGGGASPLWKIRRVS